MAGVRELIEAALTLGPMQPLTEPVEVDMDAYGWVFEAAP